jgi:Fic family protein
MFVDLERLDRLRERLAVDTGTAGPWLGRLRRQARAQAASSSVEIEGFRVPPDEALRIERGETQPEPGSDDALALSSYLRAMDHVGVMASDPQFRWLDRVVLDLHFDAVYYDTKARPGLYRQVGIEVTAPGGGPPAYVGPPAAHVPALMDEVVDWLSGGDLGAHVVVRAAMAHLHVVSVHPFRDGNGRIARIVQSLVLALEGVIAPELGSIEEYLADNSTAYFSVLQRVQGGSYLPTRDAGPWVSFCLKAHLAQAQRRVERIEQAAARWSRLEDLVRGRDWPDRLVIALEQALFGVADRAAYVKEAAVAPATASGDLRRLVDAGLLRPEGRGRLTGYVPTDALRRMLADETSEG